METNAFADKDDPKYDDTQTDRNKDRKRPRGYLWTVLALIPWLYGYLDKDNWMLLILFQSRPVGFAC